MNETQRYYTASATKDGGRETYSVIFRHPVRMDPGTARPGRRVRRSLGTREQAEAQQLVEELNTLLRLPEYWSVPARGTAEGRFSPRVVSIFYDGMEARERESAADREAILPLPAAETGYRRVLFLGTTGAGKTTLLRQLLGTDPETERFPSTSTAKTTIADTEIIVSAGGAFSAVVTFATRDDVIDHLTDCASKASLLAMRGGSNREVRTALLDHENQRFRFSYVLGRGESGEDGQIQIDSLADFDDEPGAADEDGFRNAPSKLDSVDLERTNELVEETMRQLRLLAKEHEAAAYEVLGDVTEADESVRDELVEEELDAMLRGDERFNALVDGLLDEIELRFSGLEVGEIKRDQTGWPRTWSHESDDRPSFLGAVGRFSSNYAPRFGHLLSPLVDGIRVQGPFRPDWSEDEETPGLVLIDIEGLGHTPKSTAEIPTSVARVIDEVDVVLLVDNAEQPMQAAPATAVRSLVTGGNTNKLVFCFTHFDAVTGDNLQTDRDRAQHVLASAENLLTAIGNDFGTRVERSLRLRLKSTVCFLGNLQHELDTSTQAGARTVKQLRRLVTTIVTPEQPVETGPSRPVYDSANLVLAISEAVTWFHERWQATLGLVTDPAYPKEHWTRVKALNRRFAEQSSDEYDTLQPAANLRESLKFEIYKTLQAPVAWEGQKPSEEEVAVLVDDLANAVARGLQPIIRERLRVEPLRQWQQGYALSGPGSTFVRARVIANEIFDQVVPAPRKTPTPDRNEFLRDILAVLRTAAEERNVGLI